MTYFTDNPLERLMQQKPEGGRKARPQAPPKDRRCPKCPHYQKGCDGTCHRDLLIRQKPKGEPK